MATKVHLLVMIHGMWGDPTNLAAMAAAIKEGYADPNKHGEELDVLIAETNKDSATYDGIDWGGERVADEVYDRVRKLEEDDKKVVKLSVTGYSLGGLIARYMLGVLHRRGFFEDVERINFNTVATPHLGLLQYPSMFSSIAGAISQGLLSRTGVQFYCRDKWTKTGRPLLEVMADPDELFYRVLSQFQSIRIYANAVNDVTVPYCTAAIETKDIFAEYVSNGINIEMKKGYEYLVDTYTLSDTLPPKPAVLSREWFDRMKPRPLLPPALQFRFPFNFAFYAIIPILLVPAISYLFYRLSSESSASRLRIKDLESDESYRERLASVFQELEREMEDAAAEIVENEQIDPYPILKAKSHPIVTPLQKKMARWLNQLPLKKELAFFPKVRNSHAMIVCRDIRRFPVHKMGESVVRHWVDHFIF